MSNYNFEQGEQEFPKETRLELVDLTDVPVAINMAIHGALLHRAGHDCDDETHKNNSIVRAFVFEFLTTREERIQIIIPEESFLGQGFLSGQVLDVVKQRMDELTEQTS